MTRKPTIKEIAEKAGVNPSTVSRVLNNSEKYKISSSVKEKIQKIMSKLEYEPKSYAQSLKTGRSNNLGIILHDLERDFASLTASVLWASFCREAVRRGFNPVIMPLEKEEFDEQIVKKIRAGSADGYFIGGSLAGTETQKELSKRNIPAVSYVWDNVSAARDLKEISALYTDNSTAFNQLTDMMLKSCLRKAAVFGPFKDIKFPRVEEFIKISENKGIETENLLYQGSRLFAQDWHEAYKAAKQNMDKLKRHSFIFCTSDLVAMGLCEALRKERIIPGKDISVSGYDNLEENPNFRKEKAFLTTIDKNENDVGKMLMQELCELVSEKKKKELIKLDSKLTLRQSTIF